MTWELEYSIFKGCPHPLDLCVPEHPLHPRLSSNAKLALNRLLWMVAMVTRHDHETEWQKYGVMYSSQGAVKKIWTVTPRIGVRRHRLSASYRTRLARRLACSTDCSLSTSSKGGLNLCSKMGKLAMQHRLSYLARQDRVVQ